jgi:predicted site-specific integrase-resolvase
MYKLHYFKFSKIYITYNDKLTILSSKTITDIFAKFGTEIIFIEGKKKNINDLTNVKK